MPWFKSLVTEHIDQRGQCLRANALLLLRVSRATARVPRPNGSIKRGFHASVAISINSRSSRLPSRTTRKTRARAPTYVVHQHHGTVGGMTNLAVATRHEVQTESTLSSSKLGLKIEMMVSRTRTNIHELTRLLVSSRKGLFDALRWRTDAAEALDTLQPAIANPAAAIPTKHHKSLVRVCRHPGKSGAVSCHMLRRRRSSVGTLRFSVTQPNS